MKALTPAEVRAEPAEPGVEGMSFQDAAGRRCLWPLSGSGADMVVCGAQREPGCSYCLPHKRRAGGAGGGGPRVSPD